jgi:hypothetical protein
MGRHYREKMTGERVPEGEEKIRRAQEEQRKNRFAKIAAAEAFSRQDVPYIRIKHHRAFCPYANCGRLQRYVTIGIHACTYGFCTRNMEVPDCPRSRQVGKKGTPIIDSRHDVP